LDVEEFSAAVGDTFGGAPGCCSYDPPFVLIEVASDKQAVVQYSRCLQLMKHWAPLYVGEDAVERGLGPDTLTITAAWRHLTTGSIDGGCHVSVRVAK
jgi:hypothetical protein